MRKYRRKIKRLMAVVCAAALAASLCACGEDSESSSVETADATLYGQVEEIGDNTITLLLGEMVTESESSEDADSADTESSEDTDGTDTDSSEDADSSDTSSDDQSDTGSETGEVPTGDFSGDGEMPTGEAGDFEGGEAPTGEAGDMETPTNEEGETIDMLEAGDFSGDGETSAEGSGDMEIPTNEDGEAETMAYGEAPADGGDFSGGEAPTGEAGDSADGGDFSGEAPSGGDQASMGTFEAGSETVTLEVSEELADTLSSLSEGDIVQVVTDSDSIVTSITTVGAGTGGEGGDMSSSSSDVDQGSYANLIDEDGTYSDTSYTSTGDDENALRIDGATVTLENITVDKSDGSSSDVENGDFYGVNAAVLATNGAQVTITGATITSSAQNGNGVFSYGSGTVVTISDSVITTTADNSGGIQTTGGGTTNAYDLTVQTQGSSSAAIRSDRGGGTVNVSGGSYVTDGYNSPAVYSTAAITVEDATLTANNSEALVVEGQNSITLTDCIVTGNMSDEYGTSSAINVHNIMIYQSTSGDAEEGTSYFSAAGGSITSHNGDMFYITNTACVITLEDVEFVMNDSDANFMTIAGNDASNGWGSAGSNGAQVELTCISQEFEGDITVDTISTLNISLTDGTSFTGTINIVDNEEGGTAVSDNAVVTIDEDSTWTLTGDCTITSITNNGTINYNGYTITLADGTVMSE